MATRAKSFGFADSSRWATRLPAGMRQQQRVGWAARAQGS